MVIIFDLDDTLFCERQFVLSGFAAVARFLNNQLDLRADFYSQFVHLFQRGNRGNIFNHTLSNLGYKQDEDLITQMVNIYRTHQPQISLYPDASLVLPKLKGKSPMGIITDGYLTAQQNKINALKITKFFQHIIYTDEYGRLYWKPHPFACLKMMDLFGIEAGPFIYIGDNPTKDFITANKLGWLTIHIDRGDGLAGQLVYGDEYAARFKINTLLALEDTLTQSGFIKQANDRL